MKKRMKLALVCASLLLPSISLALDESISTSGVRSEESAAEMRYKSGQGYMAQADCGNTDKGNLESLRLGSEHTGETKAGRIH